MKTRMIKDLERSKREAINRALWLEKNHFQTLASTMWNVVDRINGLIDQEYAKHTHCDNCGKRIR
jgi:hypothetical protein